MESSKLPSVLLLAWFLWPALGYAGDVVQLVSRQAQSQQQTPSLTDKKMVVHRSSADFKVGDLILSREGDIGKVVGFKRGKLLVDGRWLSGEYIPSEFVRVADQPIAGVGVGYLVPDGVGGWGQILRIWEDGRLQIEGRRFSFAPYWIQDLNVSTIVPPASATSLWRGFCDRLMRSL
jgi:hypothetical protein